MEYYKDLLNHGNKSKTKLIFGIIFILISLLWILIRVIENDPIRVFDYLYSFIFLINGVVHIIESRGKSIAIFFGKAYILINQEKFEYKPKINFIR